MLNSYNDLTNENFNNILDNLITNDINTETFVNPITEFIKKITTPDELYILINGPIFEIPRLLTYSEYLGYTIFKVKVNKKQPVFGSKTLFGSKPNSIEVMEFKVYRILKKDINNEEDKYIDIENPVFEYTQPKTKGGNNSTLLTYNGGKQKPHKKRSKKRTK